jgi:hypothetical protein
MTEEKIDIGVSTVNIDVLLLVNYCWSSAIHE